MISAIVLTKNEERNIRDCLESLKWCDEILIIDDYSEDRTIQIAKKMDVRVFLQALKGDFAAQRNFGLQKAKGDWVLFVDADERISTALAVEIKSQISNFKTQNYNLKLKTNQPTGFYLKRQDSFGGRWLKHGETANVRLLRLAQKGKGRWKRRVHEIWEIKGKVGKLKNPLFHYPHPTVSNFLDQVNFHSTLHAEVLHEEGVEPSSFRIIANPLGKFLQNYLLRLGFLDGMPGLVMALMMSFHSFLARAKLFFIGKKTESKRREIGNLGFLIFLLWVIFVMAKYILMLLERGARRGEVCLPWQ